MVTCWPTHLHPQPTHYSCCIISGHLLCHGTVNRSSVCCGGESQLHPSQGKKQMRWFTLRLVGFSSQDLDKIVDPTMLPTKFVCIHWWFGTCYMDLYGSLFWVDDVRLEHTLYPRLLKRIRPATFEVLPLSTWAWNLRATSYGILARSKWCSDDQLNCWNGRVYV